MSAEQDLTPNDYELLSAYVDGMLSDSERRALEARLEAEPVLRRELSALRQTIALVKQLQPMRAPRDFTLTAEMVGARDAARPRPRVVTFPFFSAVSAAAAVLLIVFGVGLILSGTQTGDDSASDRTAREVAAQPSETVARTDSAAVGAAPQIEGTVTVAAFDAPPAEEPESGMPPAPPQATPEREVAAEADDEEAESGAGDDDAADMPEPMPPGAGGALPESPTPAAPMRTGPVMSATPSPRPEAAIAAAGTSSPAGTAVTPTHTATPQPSATPTPTLTPTPPPAGDEAVEIDAGVAAGVALVIAGALVLVVIVLARLRGR